MMNRSQLPKLVKNKPAKPVVPAAPKMPMTGMKNGGKVKGKSGC